MEPDIREKRNPTRGIVWVLAGYEDGRLAVCTTEDLADKQILAMAESDEWGDPVHLTKKAVRIIG